MLIFVIAGFPLPPPHGSRCNAPPYRHTHPLRCTTYYASFPYAPVRRTCRAAQHAPAGLRPRCERGDVAANRRAAGANGRGIRRVDWHGCGRVVRRGADSVGLVSSNSCVGVLEG